MARQINAIGLASLKQWEGLKLRAYLDTAGVWTIGYGHTSAASAPDVHPYLSITDSQAEDILKQDLKQYEQAVEKSVKVSLTDNQFAALVSFAFNVGIANFRSSTLLKKLNQGDYDAVPDELMKWVKATNPQTGKKETVRGLVNRRSAEAGLWAKGGFVSSNSVEPETHKENPWVKPETIGPIAGTIAGAGGLLSGTGPIHWALAFVMVICCLMGVYYFVKRMQKEAT